MLLAVGQMVVNEAAPIIQQFSPAFGAPGTSVIIEGANLSAVQEVRFNTWPAIFLIAAPTRIYATVPLEATTGRIGLVGAFGFVASTADFVVGPRITGFSPASGEPGDEIVIDGANFAGASAVRFNGKDAQNFSVVAPTQIRALVPANAGTGPLSVITPAGRGVSEEPFELFGNEPRIHEFSPQSGRPGTAVTLFGANFIGATRVEFNGVAAASFAVVSEDQLQAVVPAGAATGRIRVRAPSGVAESSQDFLMTEAPRIAEFSPLRGRAGTRVTVDGENFLGTVAVKFGGVASSSFSVVAPTQIHAVVPAAAATGVIRVETAKGFGTSDLVFEVTGNPIIDEFSPALGRPGSTVAISGANFEALQSVRFNGIAASSFSAVSPTQINAVVPATATSGPLTITTAGGSGSTEASFHVVRNEPLITDFQPRSALPGATVTIHGANFSGTTAVRFGGVTAPFNVVADAQILAVVPANAISGPITVTRPSGSGASVDSFLAAPRISGFAPQAGISGSAVTVSGTNFTSVTAVRFNGVTAGFSAVATNQIVAVVPPEAVSGTLSVTTPAGIVASTNRFLVLPRIEEFRPLSGPAGTAVSIQGTGFAAVESVRFAGRAAAFSLVSWREIIATVPFEATSGPLTVQTSAGSAESSRAFIFGVSADLGLSISETSDPVLAGENLIYTLTVTNRGPSLATGLSLTNSFPENVRFVGATTTSGEVKVFPRRVEWRQGSLAVNGGVDISVTLLPVTVGTLTNAAVLAGRELDPDLPSNQIVEITTVLPGPRTVEISRPVDGGVQVSWLNSATNFVLEASERAGPGVWAAVTNPVVISGDRKTVVIPNDRPSRFFRLRRP